MTTQARALFRACWPYAALALGIALLALTACHTPSEYAVKINPATGEGTATLTKVALVEPMAGNALTDVEVVPIEESGGWLGLAVTALTVVGGLQFAGPKSWANWANLLRPGASWKSTLQSLAANAGIAHTPAAAKPNIQSQADAQDAAEAAVAPQAVVVVPAKPDRSDP